MDKVQFLLTRFYNTSFNKSLQQWSQRELDAVEAKPAFDALGR